MLALAAFGLAAPAVAQDAPDHVVTSPDGTLSVAVNVNGEGRPYYTVARQGQPVIAESRLGFLMADEDKLERRLVIEGVERSSHDETWEQPWGERRYVRDHHEEMTVRFREDAEGDRRFSVTFRLFDDGVGFRYGFDREGTTRIADELTEFNFAQDGTAWWIPAGEWNRYEYLYEETPISAAGFVHTPFTVRMDSGTHVSIHESSLIDFAGMWVKRVTGTNFRASLAPTGSSAARVEKTGPFVTPWRTLRIAPDAAGLAHSDIDMNLAPPNRIANIADWFTPHKYVGVWWSLHLDEESWGSGAKHGATTANVKRYIDFAAENGFAGILVEGWNLGWDGNWFFNGGEFSFTEAYPDYDFEALADYAASKGVSLVGHHETSGDVGNYESQLEAGLDLMAAHGVKVIKSGYVTDACNLRYVHADGRETRECTESQVMQRHHLKVVEEAAKRRIAMNPHEPVKDTGLRRTYPNWVSREGARGMEFNAWGNPQNGPDHVPTLLFTRMLSGPMDFTPGIVSIEGRGQPIEKTMARTLAEYVLVYSPIQMVADLPEHYAEHPGAFDFIKRVAVDWEESRVLDAEVGDYAVVARKERGGDKWYVGGGANEEGHDTRLALDFLDAGTTYTARIWRDAEDSHYAGPTRFDYVREDRSVTAADMLSLTMAPGGGFAIELEPRR